MSKGKNIVIFILYYYLLYQLLRYISTIGISFHILEVRWDMYAEIPTEAPSKTTVLEFFFLPT